MPGKSTRKGKKKLLVSLTVLAALAVGTGPAQGATTDKEKLEEVREMFSSKYQEEDYYRTDRLLLTATKRKMSLREAPAIATVITADEIAAMGARNLMDVLQTVPGIGVSRNEQGFFMFDVRGISTVKSEKILLMIDGHSLNKNYTSSGLVNFGDYLSVDNIRQIEIVRGPGSALYGDSAFVAVINVITKEAYDLEGVEVKLSGGSFDTTKLSIVGGDIFDNGLQAFGSLNYWQTSGPDLTIAQDQWRGTAITRAPGDADTTFEALELFVKLAYKDLTYEGHLVDNSRGVYIGFANALTDDNHLKFQNFWHELAYRRALTPSLTGTAKLYWDHFEQDAMVQLQPPGFNGSFPEGMIGGPMCKASTVGGELQFDYDLTARNHLLLGLHYEKMRQYDVQTFANYDVNNAYLGGVVNRYWALWNKDAKRESYAAYLQDEWEVVNNVKLTAGVRYDHYNDFGDTTNPRAGLVWNFSKKGEIKLLYGEAFRAPNFSELYNDNNPSLMGNEALEAEEITTYEAAIGYRLTEKLGVDLNYFYLEIANQINRDTTVAPNVYANIGGTVSDGVECVLNYQFGAEDYLKLRYTYQDPRDADTDRALPFVPHQRVGGSVNYALSRNISAHADVSWTGERSRPSGDSRAAVDPYTTVNVAVTAKNFYRGLEIRGAIYNLFDERYVDPDLSGATQYIPYDYPRAGISGMVTVAYKF
ncbi:MAG: TonB-dependent receptor [Desulfobulbaceae bacterium]|nr:TonB-dependent receptor [Desulfobulbaceae bacterium]